MTQVWEIRIEDAKRALQFRISRLTLAVVPRDAGYGLSVGTKFYDAPVADVVLDAVDAAGFRHRRPLARTASYENLQQVGVETAPLVAAPTPWRWSDDAIAEEHAFALELPPRERSSSRRCASAVRRRSHTPASATHHPRRGGRAPELESTEHLA